MTFVRLRSTFLAIGIIASSDAFGAEEQEPAPSPDAPTELDPITVTGKRIFLYDSDRQLAKIIDGLLDLGTSEGARSGFVGALQSYFEQHKDPNALRPEQQAMIIRMTEGGPSNLP